MSNKKIAIERQFNRSAAGSYDTHAHVQRDMARRLAASLKQWMSSKDVNKINILEIGCGTGTLTEMLVNQWSCASITAIDLAPAMIQAAEDRIRLSTLNMFDDIKGRSSHVRFLLADVEKWVLNAPSESFDLIISNACFQWLSEPKKTLEQIGRLLRKDGLLAFATFGPDTFRELHASFFEAYRTTEMEPQRHGLSFQSADQWRELLKDTGFSEIRDKQYCCTEEYASVRDFLLSVKAQGASTSEAVRSRSHVPRRLFANMFKEYDNRFSTSGGIAATYDLLFIQALHTK